MTIAELIPCAHQGYPCNHNNMVRGEGKKISGKNWYEGFSMIRGAKLYVGCLKTSEAWWKLGPPQAKDRPGPYFTTVIKRAESFHGFVLEYDVAKDTPLVYTGPSGGFETQEDVFKSYDGYFSCKECEVSVKNSLAGDFVDWRNVRDITSLVFG